MAQVKIYGLESSLSLIKARLSDTIHRCVVKTLKIPADKRFHRFILLDQENFYYPVNRTESYLIIELMLIAGRSAETKKKLIKLLFQEVSEVFGISITDIEVCILEIPAANWGFRGTTGDEASLPYSVDI
ncbi:MAG: tautomerase family protein [Bacteroidota bacterium]